MKKGFSLLEVLIVIVILSILVSIAVPSYFKYKKKAIVARIQGDLVSCAGELMAQFADEGVRQKDCNVYNSNDTCTLVIDNQTDKIKIATSSCTFTVDKIQVKCEIRTDYGDVNGRIDCHLVEEEK